MGSSTSLSVRILFISVGFVSIAMVTSFCFPAMVSFAVYDIPVMWAVILSWLRPPYLYVVINGIIITIAASSRFHHHYNHYYQENQSQPLVDETNSLPPPDLPSELQPMLIHPSFDVLEQSPVVFESEVMVVNEPPEVYESEYPIIDVETVPMNVPDVTFEAKDKFVVERSAWNSLQPILNSHSPEETIQSEIILPAREKPLLSSRFANQRRTGKINPEGMKSLRVTKPRKHETLESTWKTITDGRHIPLNRHLRKPDTFENHLHNTISMDKYPGEQGPASPADNNVMHNSEGFNDRTDYGHQNNRIMSSENSLPASTRRLRKEGSLSHDDLNRRVEAFIKKFNDEMRLQRQESLKRYMDMINRGAELEN